MTCKMAHMGKTRGQVLLFICVVFLVSVVKSGKYSEDVNKKKDAIDQERPFRINKLNIHWHAAKQNLGSHELPDLYAELAVQDKMELDWKKRKHEGEDEDGEEEAALRNRLSNILTQFGLKDERSAAFRKNAFTAGNDLEADLRFNKKLSKLWQKAQMAGFSEEELNDLKSEFLHHQEKLQEIEDLKAEIDDLDGIQNVAENSVNSFHENKNNKKLMKEKHLELKEKYRDIKKDYEYLEALTQEDLSPKDVDFKNPKVIQLWSQAKRANFTEIELNSFKEELRHFEYKLKKHEILQKEAEMSAFHSNSGSSKVNKLSDSNEKLEDRVKEYGQKMKKIHTELKMRISERTEL